MKLIQIVPRLGTELDGIGDYAVILAKKLRSLYGIETVFLACEPALAGPDVVEEFVVKRLTAHDGDALAESIRGIMAAGGFSPSVVMQFAPYGYEQRGCPIWLLKGLRDWKNDQRGRLLTMFHELDARGNAPWKSSFWLNPLQRYIIKELSGICDERITNNMYCHEILSEWDRRDVRFSPTFSNIGEPPVNISLVQRNRQMVVFGRPWQRRRSYFEGREELSCACKSIGAEEILDIGAPISDLDIEKTIDIPVRSCGRLSSFEISELLSLAMAGFIYYPKSLLTKSGVFASYCAHGVIPFVAGGGLSAELEATHLVDKADFVSVSEDNVRYGDDEMQDFSNKTYAGYQSRNSVEAAGLYAELIR